MESRLEKFPEIEIDAGMAKVKRWSGVDLGALPRWIQFGQALSRCHGVGLVLSMLLMH